MSFDSAVPASPNIFSSRMKRRRGWGEEAEERDFFFSPSRALPREQGEEDPALRLAGSSGMLAGMLAGGCGVGMRGEEPS